jgi:predicted aconitase with swiveling domain
VLAECLRRGTGPAAILLSIPDPILTVGAIVARTLYGVSCPIVVCSIAGLRTGMAVRVEADDDGRATIGC